MMLSLNSLGMYETIQSITKGNFDMSNKGKIINTKPLNSREAPKFVYRYPSYDTRDRVHESAVANKRSINKEISYLIEKGLNAETAGSVVLTRGMFFTDKVDGSFVEFTNMVVSENGPQVHLQKSISGVSRTMVFPLDEFRSKYIPITF